VSSGFLVLIREIIPGAWRNQPDTPFSGVEHCVYGMKPFPSRTSQANLVYGRLTTSERLRVRSLMPENGVIFSDGIEADRLDFNSGTEVQITIADRAGQLIV
jgi:hypothetical protein